MAAATPVLPSERERTMHDEKDIVIVSGSSGFIGSAVIEKLAGRFTLLGFDRDVPPHPPPAAECVCIDLTDDRSIGAALERVRVAYGTRIASVIHLAAYFDLTGEPGPKYAQVTVRRPERLLRALDRKSVGQGRGWLVRVALGGRGIIK